MNRNDRRIVLAALGMAVVASVGLYLLSHDAPATESSATERPARAARSDRPAQYYRQETKAPERFAFDPNTADSTQLLRLGLQPWQVRNIYKYRARGGIYRRKEDFARLYGLTVGQYRELEPYIRISADYQPAATLLSQRTEARAERDTMRYPVKLRDDEQIVLNTADTAQLRRVPGIGSYYAREIIRYGTWLGGYVSVDQLDEIEGFPTEAKKYFVVEHATPRRLNINRLTLAQLRRHPYINYYQAKAMVDYRRLHGDIGSLDDLRFSRDFPPEAIERLKPYVEY